MTTESKTRNRALRRRSQKKGIKAIRNSRVGQECPQCGDLITPAPGPGEYDPFSVTTEHIQPVDPRYGGLDNQSNYEIICRSCQCARNQIKQFYENRNEPLPDKFWLASIYHNKEKFRRVLEDVFPNEWKKFREILSLEQEKKEDFLKGGKRD